MMETAREMFERLGYADRYEDAVMISYKKYYDGQNSASIKFLKPEGIKGVIAVDDNWKSKKITIEELEAIQKQMEELEWLEKEKKRE